MARNFGNLSCEALAALSLLLVGCVVPAEAQLASSVSVLAKIAVDPSVGGTIVSAASGAVAGRQVSINETSWTDSHSRQSPLFEGGFGFRAGKAAEVIALFDYGRAGADQVVVGSVDQQPLRASFDRYSFWGLQGGVRLRPSSGLGPYASLTGGFLRVDAIAATLANPAGDFTGVSLYDASTVPALSVGGGMLFGSNGLALGFEVGLRYAGEPNAAVDVNPAVKAAATAGARWSLPVSFVFRF